MPFTRILLATILGGIAIFIGGAVSHIAIPLYDKSLLRFNSEEAVTQAITANAPKSGVYFMPNLPVRTAGMTGAQYAEAKQAAMANMTRGPFVFAGVRLGSINMPELYIKQVLTDLLGAYFLTIILLQLSAQSYWSRVSAAVLVACVAVMIKVAPNATWYGFGSQFLIGDTADAVVRLLAGGLVIAAFTGSRNMNPVKIIG